MDRAGFEGSAGGGDADGIGRKGVAEQQHTEALRHGTALALKLLTAYFFFFLKQFFFFEIDWQHKKHSLQKMTIV